MKAKFLRIGSSVGTLALLISGNFLFVPTASHASSVCVRSSSSRSASSTSAPTERQRQRMVLERRLATLQEEKKFLECRLNRDQLNNAQRRSIQISLARINREINNINNRLRNF